MKIIFDAMSTFIDLGFKINLKLSKICSNMLQVHYKVLALLLIILLIAMQHNTILHPYSKVKYTHVTGTM